MLALPRMLKPMNRRPSRGRRRNDLLVTSAVVFLGVLVFACVGMLIPPMRAAVVDPGNIVPRRSTAACSRTRKCAKAAINGKKMLDELQQRMPLPSPGSRSS